MRIADLSDLANVRQKLPFDSFQQEVLNLKQQISHQIGTPAGGLFVPAVVAQRSGSYDAAALIME